MATAATSLNSFKEVQAFLNAFVTKNSVSIGTSPHGDFWNGLSYKDFTDGNVPGVEDAGMPPTKILVKGDSSKSPIIQALRGMVAPFDPASFPGPMPPTGKALPMSTPDIKELADWIDKGCPE